jgi:hypothetical protein
MRNAGTSAASSCTSSDHSAALFHTGEPRATLETRRMRTFTSTSIQQLRTTAIVHTLPVEAPFARRTLPSWRTLLSVFAAFATVLALIASHRDAQAAFAPSPIDRGMVVESLQTLSDYVGFEGHFALGRDDRTLVMTGSDLCGDDFPQVVPPALWHRVVESGFEVFECSAAGVQVRLAVHP